MITKGTTTGASFSPRHLVFLPSQQGIKFIENGNPFAKPDNFIESDNNPFGINSTIPIENDEENDIPFENKDGIFFIIFFNYIFTNGK